MNLTHVQWLDVLCSMMEADPQPPEAIAAMRATFDSPHTTADLKEFLHHGLYAARFHPAEVRARFEALLRSKNLPPLAKLDTGFIATCSRVLKRGSIRTDEECYIVAEILGGPEYHELSPAQQKALGEIRMPMGKEREMPNKSPEPTLTVRPFSVMAAALETPSSLWVSVAHL